jgi:3-oxo-5-alpha-steroid 4-dehydrogenase 1
MNELNIYRYLIFSWFILASFIFSVLLFIIAPYGRHATRNWGLTISNRIGWIVMESTAPVIFFVCFIFGSNRINFTSLAFLILWLSHYVHRAFIYPWTRRDGPKPMPILVVALGFLFNAVNAYLNGRYIFTLSDGYPNRWLEDPRFIIGAFLFIAGFYINRQSDLILRNLRQPGETDYHIAQNGLYRWISCPNYLGEIIIWIGWAVATWSIAGLAFAFWTAANLIPRARFHHIWYRNKFADYSAERVLLILSCYSNMLAKPEK